MLPQRRSPKRTNAKQNRLRIVHPPQSNTQVKSSPASPGVLNKIMDLRLIPREIIDSLVKPVFWDRPY